MPITELPLTKGTGSDLSADFRDNLPVNYIYVPKPEHPYMRSAPGLTKFTDAPGRDRGAIYNERFKEQFRVSQDKLISVDTFGVVKELGVIPQLGQCSMSYSFNTQCVVNDGEMYLYDSVNGFRQVTDPDLGGVFDVTWINGRYFMTDGEFLVVTELNDESAIEPLKYGSSEYSPDPILAVGKTADNKAIAFNRYTIEYFVDTGTTGFPFQRIDGRALRSGIVGTHAKCEILGTYAVIGGGKEETPSVYLLGAGTLDKIATREIDEILKSYTELDLSEAVLEARTEDGHYFVICRLARDTLMYDVATKQWCILKSDVNGDQPWRGTNGVYDPRNGKWIYGDVSSFLGYLDESTPTQYGDVIEGIMYTPITYFEGMSINELKLKHLPGRGGFDANPRALLSMSNDGLTFNQEYSLFMGGRGNYHRQFIIRRLGFVRDYFSLKIRIASKAPTAFSRLTVDYS